MVLPTVLKRRHSLRDRDIVLELIKKVKATTDVPKEWARLQPDKGLEDLTQDALAQAFTDITAKECADFLELMNREMNIVNLRILVHSAIILANEIGQPKGQDLVEPIAGPSTAPGTAGPTRLRSILTPPTPATMDMDVNTQSAKGEAVRVVKEKIAREIELHRNLKNKNVVEFHNFFEDDDNVYIVLEHCSKKSLVHILKNRKTLTEPEVRFYVKHLLEGCRYIHSQRIIHRDLKLGNMLLNEKMELKIADFGLATRVNFVGDKKMTVCGTPNYIAPEVLQKKGHSYEADMWAVGCIMFAMLVGRPPFETPTLKETYLRIATNKFFIPSNISDPARLLMRKILSPSPDTRPTIDEILADDFFTSGYMPQTLPTACCTSAPKFPVSYSTPQTPVSIIKETTFTDNIIETHHVIKESRYPTLRVAAPEEKIIMRPPPHVLQPAKTKENARECARNGLDSRNGILAQGATTPDQENISPRDVHSSQNGLDTTPRCGSPGLAVKLQHRIGHCLDRSPTPCYNENPAPVTNPNVLWISKWVDYSNKYGFGFQLSNRSVGVLFNDTARISLGPDGKSAQYCDLTGRVTAFQVDAVPTGLQKRSTLLTYFATYMNENLIQGGDMEAEGADRYPGGIFMKKWFRTSKAIVMYLSNGTLQVNFFEDHTKIIMSTAIDGEYLLTLIDENRRATTYYLEDITQLGCDDMIRDRLVYSYGMLKNILDIEGEDI